MAATYVTEAELRSTLGIENLYSSTVVEEVCQAAENVIKGYLWFNKYYASAHSADNNVGTLYFDVPHGLYVGESVIVANAGSAYNGTKTITAASEFTISFAVSRAYVVKHPIYPYATVSGDTYVDYATLPEVRESSLMVAVDIWQSRQLSSTGGMSPDGFTQSPWRMSNGLIAKIRGLIANWINPAGLVG
jgi:hypothetical protein